ncbi:Hypothetical predicted protein [Cloeon dipterum]|uniref:Uncharacterized protein n=1 Tax=Cloeon dipterum TaxID=197152 RepID=A0A8S1BRZ2_9INSE|nr:Hypothetical predicted protein [Cloeon dipterum]
MMVQLRLRIQEGRISWGAHKKSGASRKKKDGKERQHVGCFVSNINIISLFVHHSQDKTYMCAADSI